MFSCALLVWNRSTCRSSQFHIFNTKNRQGSYLVKCLILKVFDQPIERGGGHLKNNRELLCFFI
jgi:hypothetical protein